MVPPRVRLVNSIPLHPNIHPTSGEIDLDILRDKWNPALNLPTVLLSIRVLLGAPNFDNPCFQNVSLTAVKAAASIRRLRCHEYGTFYAWMWKQELFQLLPRDVWYNYVLPKVITLDVWSAALKVARVGGWRMPRATLEAARALEVHRHVHAVRRGERRELTV